MNALYQSVEELIAAARKLLAVVTPSSTTSNAMLDCQDAIEKAQRVLREVGQ